MGFFFLNRVLAFVILPDPFKRRNPVSFKAFIPCFFNDCLMGTSPVMTSCNTEDPNCLAAGLAALNINGKTFLAALEMSEKIYPPLRRNLEVEYRVEIYLCHLILHLFLRLLRKIKL